jgi:hypothetical protein
MTDLQRNKLNKVIGIPYCYNGKNIVITKFKEVSGTNVVIFVNDRPIINLLNHEIDDFLFDLNPALEKELKPTQVAVPENKMLIFEPTKDNTNIKATLLETLEKVKNDPNYIPQATAVCNIVNQIVNVQKTEIQMLQILNSKK